MHLNTLTKQAKALLPLLSQISKNDHFLLAGGTSLALQFGHRKSDDFDFFSEQDFSINEIKREFEKKKNLTILMEDKNTLVIMVDEVKLSFFRYWDHFLFDPVVTKYFPLAHPKDIALMKLVAISQRGSRKDFIDLYFLLNKVIGPRELFLEIKRKFPKSNYNKYHLLKSLTFFDDAESEPMPMMLVPFNWNEIKHYFVLLFAKEIE